MIDLVRAWNGHAAYVQRLIGLTLALVVAEMFYRFHSFLLECLAFLATWYLFDVLLEAVLGKPDGNKSMQRKE